MKRILIVLWAIFYYGWLPAQTGASGQASGADQSGVVKKNQEKLKDYKIPETRDQYVASWQEVKTMWADSRKDLLNWPVASELEQINRVEMFYNFLLRNATALNGSTYANKSSLKAQAAAFANIILRTDWSIIINREAYSFYPLLKYVETIY
jgi:hypothetical protein